VCDGMGDASGFDQQRRHPRRESMGLGLLGRKWPERSLL
jgi:hypothetical protein